jgi:DNA polymerase-3 subunit delta'
MKPYEGRYRVVILTDAHCMNLSASNAFLKILEEPPEHTVFILITNKISNLLQTVTSRCQHIQFKPISRSRLATMVSQKENKEMDEAIILAAMAKGSLSKALSMNRSDWIGRRNWLISALGLDMSESKPSKSMRFIFSISAQLLKNRDILDDSLETITSWLRDLIVYKYQPEKVIHKDLIDIIKNVSKKFTIKSLLNKIKEVQSTQLAMQRPNANMKLALDLLILKLAQP